MKVWRILAGSTILGVFLAVAAISLSGIALTGPDQSFTISRGATKHSYLRVWNQGSDPVVITIEASGAAAAVLTISDPTLNLEPGQDAVVDLTYTVPADFPTGKCEGSVEARTGGTISASLLRPISLWITEASLSDSISVSLEKGLNLVSWSGQDLSFEEAFPSHQGIERVWRRTGSGDYIFARYYAGSGWWSSDPSFTGLRCGEAYFIECSGPYQMEMPRHEGTRVLDLKAGTNLVGWAGVTMPVEVAFPQSQSYHPITKIWRRNPDGSYSAIQFFPDQGIWWSADQGFTSLEAGRAYFVECREDVSLEVAG